jgi:hypothetical protein
MLVPREKKQFSAIGFVTGKLPVAFTAQIENGISFKNWFVGAGFGIDLYYKKTLPLFIAVKKEFSFKKSSLFLYANAGKNIILKNKQTVIGRYQMILSQGGFYGDAGIGYKMKTSKRSNVFFSLGSTVKYIEEIEKATDFLGMPGISDVRYKFSRISFRIGFQF